MTILAPSEKANKKAGRRHKTTIEWAVQLVKILRRWLPDWRIILTTDGGFANTWLAWTCLKQCVSLVTRLRNDACLYDFPARHQGRGRPSKKGRRLLSPKQMFKKEGLQWTEAEVRWYKGKRRRVAYAAMTCMWGAQGSDPLPIRLVLLKDLVGEYESIALMGVDASFGLTAIEIIEWFVARWNQEVTHREVREHLGVETQRQWSDKAIARTTPALFALYSIVCLIADSFEQKALLKISRTAWYKKESLTFADLLREVRRHLWEHKYFNILYRKGNHEKIFPPEYAAALMDQLAEIA
jgi:hypothetical protein